MPSRDGSVWPNRIAVDVASRFALALWVRRRIEDLGLTELAEGLPDLECGMLTGFTSKDEAMTAAALLGDCMTGNPTGATRALYALAGWHAPPYNSAATSPTAPYRTHPPGPTAGKGCVRCYCCAVSERVASVAGRALVVAMSSKEVRSGGQPGPGSRDSGIDAGAADRNPDTEVVLADGGKPSRAGFLTTFRALVAGEQRCVEPCFAPG